MTKCGNSECRHDNIGMTSLKPMTCTNQVDSLVNPFKSSVRSVGNMVRSVPNSLADGVAKVRNIPNNMIDGVGKMLNVKVRSHNHL